MKNSKHFGHTSINSPTVHIIFHRQSCPGVTYNCYSKPNNNLLARLYYTRQCSTSRTAPGFRPQPHEHFPQCPGATDHVVNQTHKCPVPFLPLLVLSTYAGFTTRPHYESLGTTRNQLRKITYKQSCAQQDTIHNINN